MLKIKNKIPSALTIGGKIVERIKMRNEVVWEKVVEPVDADYFYVENTYAGKNTISVKQTIKGEPDSSLYTKTLQYSKDKETWTTITLSSTSYTIDLNQGEKVYFRNNEGVFNHYVIRGTEQVWTNIIGNQSHNIGGNINTLINYYTPNNLTLPQGVFCNVFRGNANLVSAENLTLQPSLDGSLPVFAYLYLFRNCTSLINPPVLIAKTLSNSSYYSMFEGCTSLNNLTVYADDVSATNCTYNWLNNVAPEGILFNYGNATYTENSPSGIPTGWVEDKAEYFYVKNEFNDTNNITFRAVRRPRENTIQEIEYSKNKINWTKETITANMVIDIPLSQGEKVYFRNDNGYFSNNLTDTNAFRIKIRATNNHSIGGDITTLYNYSYNPNVTMPDGCFRYLFGCDLDSYNNGNVYELNPNLIDASELKLPSICLPTVNNKKTLPTNCYVGMFMLTTGLIKPPKNIECEAVGELSCYRMFKGSNITVAPILLATNVGVNGYAEMFMECNYLNVAPELPATSISDYSYYNMFSNSNVGGSVTLPATTLGEYCYSAMFEKTSITQATILAKVLKKSCMSIIFADCNNLSNVTVYATDTSSYILENIFNNWLRGVASEGVLYNLGTLTFTENSPSGIPEGWTEVKS